MDANLQQELRQLLELTQEQTAYKDFIQAKAWIEKSEIAELLQQIEQAQKNSVHLNHYHKNQAYEQNEAYVEELHQQLASHADVHYYRECLYEANDLLHYITTTLEEGINKEDDYV